MSNIIINETLKYIDLKLLFNTISTASIAVAVIVSIKTVNGFINDPVAADQNLPLFDEPPISDVFQYIDL